MASRFSLLSAMSCYQSRGAVSVAEQSADCCLLVRDGPWCLKCTLDSVVRTEQYRRMVSVSGSGVLSRLLPVANTFELLALASTMQL